MFSHDDIWMAIDSLANDYGYSTSGLAKKAGLDPTAFNRSKRMSPEGKPRWPSTESVAKILAVTNVTMVDFMTYIHIETPLPKAQTQAHTIPILPLSLANDTTHFTAEGYPHGTGWNTLSCPDFMGQNQSLYALKIDSDRYQPLCRKGDILILTPQSSPRQGDRVIIQAKERAILIGDIKNTSGETLDILPCTAIQNEHSLPLNDIDWVARILWIRQ